MYTHLHNHTYYSLLDGLNSPVEMAETAKELGQPGIAITDHGTLAGHREMQKACRQVGIKPILGVEAYISSTDRFDRRPVKKRDDNTSLYNHITLLAKNNTGLTNIRNMNRIAWEEGYYYKPRIDLELLEEYSEGVIVLSGCMNGLMAKSIERREGWRAYQYMKQLQGIFGGDFYLEVQAHNPRELNHWSFMKSTEHKIKTVATSDCHFTRPELRPIEDALLILSTNPSYDPDVTYAQVKDLGLLEKYNELYPDRQMTFEHIDVYMQSKDEITQAFAKEGGFHYKDSIANTQEIVDKIQDYEFVEHKNFLPVIVDDPDSELRNKAVAGLLKRFPEIPHDYMSRLNEELEIIADKDFSPYFLVVEDMVNIAKENDILVGPGRGSAAGSLVCYALGITNVDPLRWGLLFFRFIDPERDDFPDIDIDFMRTRRTEIKQELIDKYKHVASISNFNYFAEKGVIKDAARVLRVPYGESNKLTKLIDGFDDFLDSNVDYVEKFRTKYPDVAVLARKLKGRIRAASMHAAGVVVSNTPLEDFAPIESREDPNDKTLGRIPVVAWDKDQCEDVGLIKLDVLGLNQLDVIDEATKLIKASHPDYNEDYMQTLDDSGVFKMLSEGDTIGVFQCDASPYRKLLRSMGVDNFNDLAASNALVRPGAANTVGKDYIARKNGQQTWEEESKIIRDITEDTYGVVIYQEQVMLMAEQLGGFTRSEANKLRKIIGKKKDPMEFKQFFDKWIEGATRYIDHKHAARLWHDFEAHAGYSFNKSHAVAYSMLSYQTAWMKLNYPTEYMMALYNMEESRDRRAEILAEMKKMGIDVLIPHVNTGGQNAEIVGEKKIRLGLSDIKYISEGGFKALDKHRPFKNYADLEKKCYTKFSGINSRHLAALNAVGAATFEDNPATGKESENYHEYLNIPVFFDTIPDHVNDRITTSDYVDESGAFIMKGTVKKIRREETWALVDIMDEDGKKGVFCNPDDPIEKGTAYVFLIGDNSIIDYVPVSEFAESDAPFAQMLKAPSLDMESTDKVVVAKSSRRTKAGKLMGTLVFADDAKNLYSSVLFPGSYGRWFGRLKIGKAYDVGFKELDDGGLMFTGAR